MNTKRALRLCEARATLREMAELDVLRVGEAERRAMLYAVAMMEELSSVR